MGRFWYSPTWDPTGKLPERVEVLERSDELSVVKNSQGEILQVRSSLILGEAQYRRWLASLVELSRPAGDKIP